MVIIPARVRKPKDKAKVETAVKIAEMWILAALRNHTFFNLDELNTSTWMNSTRLSRKSLSS